MMVVPIVWYGYCQKLCLMCGNAVRCISHTILEFKEIEASTNAACYKKITVKMHFYIERSPQSILLCQTLDSPFPLPLPPNQPFCNVERM